MLFKGQVLATVGWDEAAMALRKVERMLATGTLTLLGGAGPQSRRRVACPGAAVGAYGASLRAGWLVPEQERQQHEAPPGGHLEDLVQV